MFMLYRFMGMFMKMVCSRMIMAVYTFGMTMVMMHIL